MPSDSSTSFERLIVQHKDAVYRQMVRVCGQREDAEDALATAMMQAFRAADQLASEDAFRGWLATIGRRVCSRMRHNPRIADALEFAEEIGLTATEDANFDLVILKGCVRDAVISLPEKYRDVYEKCEIEERTVPEVAEELGLSVAATKSRLLRARAMVREMLDASVCAQ